MERIDKEINKNLGDGSLFYNLKKRTVPFVFLFLFMGLVSGYAEVALIKSPLSWYEGGSGDYALPKLVNAEYDLVGFAATEGQIKTICVNYDAAGKVTVEVSADNGLHYYEIINGVPLTDNFVSGDRIKWRAKVLDEDGKLNALNTTYTDSAGTTSSFGRPELSGFNYRKEILLKNPSGQELFNYQINLKAGRDKKVKGADVNCEGNARADFYDVRFTAADGETPLAYYLEKEIASSPAAPRNDAVFWVKVPQIPKDGVKIYIYYGNSKASDLSDPKNTFDFYDDFKNTKLDANSWVVKTDPKGSSVVKDGQLKLDAAEIITKDFKFKQGVIEYAVSVESGFENGLNLREKTGDIYDNPGLVVYSSAYKGAEQCIAIDDIVKANDAKASPITAGGKYNYRLTVNDKDITFERFGVGVETQAKVTYSGIAPVKAGYLGLKSGGEGSGRNVIAYSGIRVRKFVNSQPQVDKTGTAEQVKLPIFSNIALSKKGSLILSDNIKEGVYIGKAIPAEFIARIITPTFKGINARVGVSANNGANYKEDCASANYYYASAKDFVAGTQVVGKIKLTPSTNKSVISEFTELKLDYNPGTILVVKPNGAETWNAGATEEILWSALDYDSNYSLKLEYSLNNGKNYSIITDKVNNNGAYNWKIPQDLTSQAALIRASDSNDASVSDKSDNVFTIQGAESSSSNGLIEDLKVTEKKEEEAAQKPKPVKPGEGGMYELLIKIGNDSSSGGYKEGDVVMIKPAGFYWGPTVRSKYLIVQKNLSPQEVKNLVSPQEEITGQNNSGHNTTKLLKKRKYRLNLKNKITAQDRKLALKGKLTRQPLEITAEEPLAIEEKK